MNKLLILTVLLGLTACSNKALYDNIRMNQRNECFKELPSLRQECLERLDKSYEEYTRDRDELFEN